MYTDYKIAIGEHEVVELIRKGYQPFGTPMTHISSFKQAMVTEQPQKISKPITIDPQQESTTGGSNTINQPSGTSSSNGYTKVKMKNGRYMYKKNGKIVKKQDYEDAMAANNS